MRRAFITGGSGFVGRNLINALKIRGFHVRSLARSSAAAEVARNAGAEPIRGDLSDAQPLENGMIGCDVVFHAAALVRDWGCAEDFQRVNVEGTARVLAAARRAGIRRLVYLSTEAVLLGGLPIVNADEMRALPNRPLGLYAQTKGAAEKLALAADSPDFNVIVIRPRFIWGKGDTTVLPQLIQAVREGRFRWIDGGRHLTSTCHVLNACEGLMLAAERGRGGEIYFLTDGEPVEFRGFVTALLQTQGINPGSRTVPRWAARAAARVCETAWRKFPIGGKPPITRAAGRLVGEEVTVNDAKARRELGYTSAVTRQAGLQEMENSVEFICNDSTG